MINNFVLNDVNEGLFRLDEIGSRLHNAKF